MLLCPSHALPCLVDRVLSALVGSSCHARHLLLRCLAALERLGSGSGGCLPPLCFPYLFCIGIARLLSSHFSQFVISAESLRSQLKRLRIHPSNLVFLYSSDELPPANVENK
jgi:hypothetical protein